VRVKKNFHTGTFQGFSLCVGYMSMNHGCVKFLDLKGGSQKATLVVVVLLVVVINYLKIPKAFLIRS